MSDSFHKDREARADGRASSTRQTLQERILKLGVQMFRVQKCSLSTPGLIRLLVANLVDVRIQPELDINRMSPFKIVP